MNKYRVYYTDNDIGEKFMTSIDAETEGQANLFFNQNFDNCSVDSIELQE